MNNEVHSAISGTKTEQNLNDVFGGEARSHMKYMLYADAARRSGDPVLANMLEAIAGNEKEHAELWLEYLGELDGNEKNIEAMLAGEQYEADILYPEYSREAEKEGFMEIAHKMKMVGEVENNHKEMLDSYLEEMKNGTRYTGDNDTRWMCTNCGYTHTGKNAPERCPLCGHPRAYFIKETQT